ncbi:MAG: LysR family transcriptional regulator [Desulfuromonadaceae bacterium]|nr:LysR family transcriptional regulator [Desulfuromonadaceae bacterium]
MELYQLRSFLVVAQQRNLTRAAKQINISQSALSTQIRLLEEEFGLQLFERTSRGMQLTEGGKQLLPSAQDILEAVLRLQQQAEALVRGSSGSVAIGLNSDPDFLRISAINLRHSQLYPQTSLIFHSCQSADTAARLHQEQLDLAFYYGLSKDPQIEQNQVCTVRTCVVIPHALSIHSGTMAWVDLAALPWIWVENLPFFHSLQQKLGDYRTVPNKAVIADDEKMVRELVVAGQGVAIMREDEGRILLEKGVATIWNQGWGEIPLSIGWLARRREEPRIKATLEIIRHIWQRPVATAEDSLLDKCWV